MTGAAWQRTAAGFLLDLKITPNAKADKADGLAPGANGRPRLLLRIQAPPVDGKANAAVIAWLARALGSPRAALAITPARRFGKSASPGATPRPWGRYQSGETDITGRISRCGDELARTGPIAGTGSRRRTRSWCAAANGRLCARRAGPRGPRAPRRGLAIARRRGMAKAKVAVA